MSQLIQSLMGSASASPSPSNAPLDLSSGQEPQNPLTAATNYIQNGNFEQGTMRHGLQSLMNAGSSMGNSGSIPRDDELTGMPSPAATSPQPIAQQPQPAMAKTSSPYASPNIVPTETIPAMRNTILTGRGLSPAQFGPDDTKADKTEAPVDPNSLNTRMNDPNSTATMRQQGQEALDISKQFGRKATSGTMKAQKVSGAPVSKGTQVAGDFTGNHVEGSPTYQQWDKLPGGWDKAINIDSIPKGMSVEDYVKSLPDDVEGAQLSGPDGKPGSLLYLRQKPGHDPVVS